MEQRVLDKSLVERNRLPNSELVSGRVSDVSSPSLPSSGLSQHEVLRPEDSLWALAYKDAQQANPDLIKEFNYLLGIDELGAAASADGLAQKALDLIDKADEEKLHGTSAKMRKSYDQVVKIIIASRDFIGPIASTNPYAALAWTGVSFLLPVSHHPCPSRQH